MSNLPISQGPDGPAIVDRETGEVYALADAPDALVAAYADEVKELQAELRAARGVLSDELLRRIKAAGERSIPAGAFIAEKSERREWDPDATWEALGGLVEAGLVSSKEADEAMPESTVRKPDGRKLNALLGRLVGEDPVAAHPLARARTTTPSVKVARRAVDAEAVEEPVA